METYVVNAKGQLLIPGWLRTKYCFKAGTKVAFVETSQGLMIMPVDDYFKNLPGIFKDSLPSTKEFMKMKLEEKRLEERKIKLMFGGNKKD